MIVGLVACSSRKGADRARARDLYTGVLFRRSIAYFEARGIPWAVLSAKYGVVLPDEEVEPYNVRLKDLSFATRRAWAVNVAAALHKRWPDAAYFEVLAGQEYRAALQKTGLPIVAPLAGMSIGLQLRFLGAFLETVAEGVGA